MVAVALSLFLLITIVSCYQHRRRRRHQQTPAATRAANTTTTTTRHATGDRTNTRPAVGCGRCDLAQCSCTIIVYRPSANKHRQTTSSQHRHCEYDRPSAAGSTQLWVDESAAVYLLTSTAESSVSQTLTTHSECKLWSCGLVQQQLFLCCTICAAP